MNVEPTYICEFPTKILGVKGSIEALINVSTLVGSARLAMHRMLSPNPAFVMGLSDLKTFSEGIEKLRQAARIAGGAPNGAEGPQLRCKIGGAEAVVVQGKKVGPPMLSITIGLYHWHGSVDGYSREALDETVRDAERAISAAIKWVKDSMR